MNTRQNPVSGNSGGDQQFNNNSVDTTALNSFQNSTPQMLAQLQKQSFTIPGVPGGPITLSKSGMASMAVNLLENVQPGQWNNIPIPICEGFEAVTQAIKKIAVQLELNFEVIRRKADRNETDLQKFIEDVNATGNQRIDDLAKELHYLKDNYNSFSASADIRLLHHNEAIEEINTKSIVQINESIKNLETILEDKSFLYNLSAQLTSHLMCYNTDQVHLNQQLTILNEKLEQLEVVGSVNTANQLDAIKIQLGQLQIETISKLENQVTQRRCTKEKLRKEMEDLSKKILTDVEVIVDTKTQSIVANLFTKAGSGAAGGNSRNPIVKSFANTPTIARSFRSGTPDDEEGGGGIGASGAGGPGNIYYRHSSAGQISGEMISSPEGGVRIVKKEIDQILQDYDDMAQDKLIDVDGLKLAIKRGLMTVVKNAHDHDQLQAEQTENKIVELEGHIENMEKRFSTLVQDVITKTDRLEQVIQRQLSYHSADAGAGMRSEGRFKDSLRDDDDLQSDDNDSKNKNKGGPRRSKHLGNKLGIEPNRKNSMNTTQYWNYKQQSPNEGEEGKPEQNTNFKQILEDMAKKNAPHDYENMLNRMIDKRGTKKVVPNPPVLYNSKPQGINISQKTSPKPKGHGGPARFSSDRTTAYQISGSGGPVGQDSSRMNTNTSRGGGDLKSKIHQRRGGQMPPQSNNSFSLASSIHQHSHSQLGGNDGENNNGVVILDNDMYQSSQQFVVAPAIMSSVSVHSIIQEQSGSGSNSDESKKKKRSQTSSLHQQNDLSSNSSQAKKIIAAQESLAFNNGYESGTTPIQANTPRKQLLKPLPGRPDYIDSIVPPIINIRSPAQTPQSEGAGLLNNGGGTISSSNQGAKNQNFQSKIEWPANSKRAKDSNFNNDGSLNAQQMMYKTQTQFPQLRGTTATIDGGSSSGIGGKSGSSTVRSSQQQQNQTQQNYLMPPPNIQTTMNGLQWPGMHDPNSPGIKLPIQRGNNSKIRSSGEQNQLTSRGNINSGATYPAPSTLMADQQQFLIMQGGINVPQQILIPQSPVQINSSHQQQRLKQVQTPYQGSNGVGGKQQQSSPPMQVQFETFRGL